MKIHPYANLFPMCSDDEVQLLADDIAKHGLRQPIVIDDQDNILDGRNRAAACVIAQVTPVHELFVGTDAQKLALVVSANIHRRHLTTEQRADIAAKIANMKVGENQHTGKKKKNEGGSNEPPSKPVSTKEAAKLLNVSPASVKRAKAAAKSPKEKPTETKPAKPDKAAAVAVSAAEDDDSRTALYEHARNLTDMMKQQLIRDFPFKESQFILKQVVVEQLENYQWDADEKRVLVNVLLNQLSQVELKAVKKSVVARLKAF